MFHISNYFATKYIIQGVKGWQESLNNLNEVEFEGLNVYQQLR